MCIIVKIAFFFFLLLLDRCILEILNANILNNIFFGFSRYTLNILD